MHSCYRPQLCLSMGGGCMAGGMHGGGVCVAGGCVWHGRGACTCMPPSRYYEIQLMSGHPTGMHSCYRPQFCLSVHGGVHGRGACMAGGMHGGGVWQGWCVWHGRGACMACMPPSRYYEIQLMSGRYASYWNAFLLLATTKFCGQGNIFAPVFHSVHGGGGIPEGTEADPPGSRPPPDQALPRPDTPQTRHTHTMDQTPPRGRHPPGPDTPRKQTPAYGLRAAGTHPTGMHSCLDWCSFNCKKA